MPAAAAFPPTVLRWASAAHRRQLPGKPVVRHRWLRQFWPLVSTQITTGVYLMLSRCFQAHQSIEAKAVHGLLAINVVACSVNYAGGIRGATTSRDIERTMKWMAGSATNCSLFAMPFNIHLTPVAMVLEAEQGRILRHLRRRWSGSEGIVRRRFQPAMQPRMPVTSVLHESWLLAARKFNRSVFRRGCASLIMPAKDEF